MTSDLPTVLHAEGVRFVRDRRALLDDVSLTVREGEHWALLGANGAGKLPAPTRSCSGRAGCSPRGPRTAC